MKKSKLFAITGLLTLISFSLSAQVSLPYFSGFDNAAQQNGWVEYKKAATTFSHWSIAGGGYSLPNAVGHDYSPASGITLTDNWFVSPGFSITSGGKLDSIRYKFSGMSTPDAGDTIALYLLNHSPNPDFAITKQLLFDFRGTEYVNDYTYHLKTNIVLPSSGGINFLAIRYRNTDCSSKWLSVAFDNIAINGNDVGIHELNTGTDQVSVYPNPAKDKLTIATNSNIKQSLEIYNMAGQSVYTSDLLANTTIDISGFPTGVYIIKLNSDNETLVKKFVKE
ncbi:MAG: T9SS type A sorting domain-containing protein [Bacteroidota bacterium]